MRPQRINQTEQAAKSGADFIRRYRFSPNIFAEEVLHVKLDPWQLDANDQVADYVRWKYKHDVVIQPSDNVKNFFTVRAMHGPGKTFWGAQLCCWFGSVFADARIPIIAPKFEQITTRMMLEISKIRARAHRDFVMMTRDIGASYMRWFDTERWLLFGQTARDAENLSGLHNDHQLVFVDEASGVREHLYPTIFGALSTGIIQILVLIGNPTKNTGTFAESHRRPNVAKDFCRISIPLDRAPRVSRKWVSAMRTKYGESSPIFKIRCLGEFAEMSERQLISPDWLVEARDRGEDFMKTDGSIGKIRVSVDVADGGENKSVITVTKHWQSRRIGLKQKQYSFEGGKVTAALAEEAMRLYRTYGGNKSNGDDFVVDSLGVGAGVHDYLVRKQFPVVRWIGGAAAADPKRWRCRRVQGYMALRDELRDGLLAFAPNFIDEDELADEEDGTTSWDEFDAQMCSIQTKPGMLERVEDLQTKEEMIADGIVSPDRADSLMMTYATAVPTLSTAKVPTEAGTIESQTVVVKQHDHWKDMFQEPVR